MDLETTTHSRNQPWHLDVKTEYEHAPRRSRGAWLLRWAVATLSFGGLAAYILYFIRAWIGFEHRIAYVYLLCALQPALASLVSLLLGLGWCIFFWDRVLLPFRDGGRAFNALVLVTGLAGYSALMTFAGMMIGEAEGSSTIYRTMALDGYGPSTGHFATGFIVAALLGCVALVAWRWQWVEFWRAITPLEWQEEEALERDRREAAMRMGLGDIRC